MNNDHLIEKRYLATANGRVAIDIAVGDLGQLYNPFDRQAPFGQRELDQSFVDYLVESAKEVKHRGYLIRIAIDQPLSEAERQQVRTSVTNYFIYLAELARRKLRSSLTKTLALLLAGLLLISYSSFRPLPVSPPPGPALHLLQEGLIIIAWVSLWEAFANIIFHLYPMLRKIGFYREISRAELLVIGREPDR